MTETKVHLPNNWEPRDYQLPVWRYLERGGKRAVIVWHRRGGKDAVFLNWTAWAAHDRIGTYWHLLPTAKQARKVIWQAIDRDGTRIIDKVFPKELRAGRANETEMTIPLRCGSLWQLAGADNYNSLVGANPIGVVFSEFSLCDPKSWDYIRPILAENDGWAVFPFTARGRNHGYRLLQNAKKTDTWYYQVLTVNDTKRADGSPVITQAAINEDRASGMAEETVQQEYYCSFDAANRGAYYGKEIAQARLEGRICRVPWESTLPVETWWDLGVDDMTSIVFVQRLAREIRIIDYYENNNVGLPHYAKVLNEKPYTYGDHIGPHDIKVREFGSGLSRVQTALTLGIRFSAAPKWSIQDGRQAVRAMLPRCYIDEQKCERLIDALSLHHPEWDDETKTYSDHAVHDWTSHPCDAVRTGASARASIKPESIQIEAADDINPQGKHVRGSTQTQAIEE